MAVYKKGKRYYARVYDGRNAQGKRKRVSYSFRTMKEAKAKEREMEIALESGATVAKQTLTVRELVNDYIAARTALGRIGVKQQERYEEINRLQLRSIADIPLGKLNELHIARLIADLSKNGNAKTKGVLSAVSVRHAIALLNASLKRAVRFRLISRNCAADAELPKKKKSNAKALERDDILKLLAVAERTEPFWFRLFAISLTVGGRRGEVTALHWSDIDWDKKTVTIQRALSQTKAAKTFEKPTKTENVRTVRLSMLALTSLRKQKAEQAAERLKAGELYSDNGYVFANSLGDPLNPGSVSNAFRRIAKTAKIAGRLHDLRHTFASWLLDAGENIETVRDALGHSSAYTTMTTYSHAVKRASAASVDSIDARLAEKSSKPPSSHQTA